MSPSFKLLAAPSTSIFSYVITFYINSSLYILLYVMFLSFLSVYIPLTLSVIRELRSNYTVCSTKRNPFIIVFYQFRLASLSFFFIFSKKNKEEMKKK